ncbi:MAG: ion transporter [Lentisphaeria bacterium]|nr:ion transporter [Lentisphaeria bacterium]
MNFRKKLGLFIDSDKVQNFIIFLIMLNALFMGLETFPWWTNALGQLVQIIDVCFITVFLVEILLRLYAHGLVFFKSGWNIFDFVIVAFSLIPGNGVFSCFRVMRALRIFRTARLFARIGNLRIIVTAMLKALPNLVWLLVLLFIFFYIFAVLTTTLFGKMAPEKFGDIFVSFYSLFSLMTMEGWQDIVETVKSPYSKVVFIPFMLISSYIFLNLVVGIIVAAMEDIVKKEKEKEEPNLKDLAEKVDRICELLEKKK